MKCIVVDTSSILFGLSNRVNLIYRLEESFPDYRIIIPRGVLTELKSIGKSRRKERGHANLAVSIINNSSLEPFPSLGQVDDWILKNAKARKWIVCTNDTELKIRLRSRFVKVVSLSRSGAVR